MAGKESGERHTMFLSGFLNDLLSHVISDFWQMAGTSLIFGRTCFLVLSPDPKGSVILDFC